ncbi:MAG TPA: glycoside hydrolase family 3 N-terminal domain-containing protein [Melioribacteraceae bacterium]|nr:glycoside hydrolase family 3 N-terminal domain-containing protein [Melioribacteraceae bacterium]
MKKLFVLLFCFTLVNFISAQKLGKDPKIEKKVKDLLSKMTLEEKIGQMTQVDMLAVTDMNDISKYFIGSVLSGGGSDPKDISAKGWADNYDLFQSYALKTRLKIPMIYGVDGVHGHNNVDGAVVFPHNIGLGATDNPKLIKKANQVIATEIAATGIDWTFAPCVAVTRDERWGRTYESFGEDPELVSKLGRATVEGLQGNLSSPTSILGCSKHYVGDGGTTNGKDQGNTEMDFATLRKIHLPGYIETIKANVGSIMVSYNSWNGEKLHGHKYLLTDVLKKELDFNGFLVSDWAAIDQLPGDYKSDVEKSINAGLDMVMIPNGLGKANNYVEFVTYLKELVNEGKVSMERIDDAVTRVLRIKFMMKLFERPYTDKKLTKLVGSQKHREVARQCVRESLVLLKNDGILPLKKNLQHIHISGSGADNLGRQCGGWTIAWQGAEGEVLSGGTNFLKAVKQTVSKNTKVTYSLDGTNINGAQFAIVVVAEKPYAEMFGDTTNLVLSPEDLKAIENVKNSKIPYVVVLYSGRPLIITDVIKDANAFVAAWLPGTEGKGVTDVLFGDFNFKGKLPISWPKNMEQLPINVGDNNYDPLFKFGFGLNYKK